MIKWRKEEDVRDCSCCEKATNGQDHNEHDVVPLHLGTSLVGCVSRLAVLSQASESNSYISTSANRKKERGKSLTYRPFTRRFPSTQSGEAEREVTEPWLDH